MKIIAQLGNLHGMFGGEAGSAVNQRVRKRVDVRERGRETEKENIQCEFRLSGIAIDPSEFNSDHVVAFVLE